ncbi:MAG: HD domain-containing protein [Oscillospiraceae bacterium]|nr:HD domain-containing protein [Oscillospiraceae bacterium]
MQNTAYRAAQTVLAQLNAAGHEAYLVGGCVRDRLMGRVPNDYDITTSALPQQVKDVFADLHTIDTGLAHGTVTVMVDGFPTEITTYRTESGYSDSRHPDKVGFVRSLKEDLARRDLTVNAMAMDSAGTVHDYFGGEADLRAGLLRAVGDADARFTEDPLRMLRTLRFAAKLGFATEPQTEAALYRNREKLSLVAMERIREELIGLLMGDSAGRVLAEHFTVLCVFMPQLLPMQDMPQHNPHHIHDLLHHTAAVVDAAPKDPALRLAAFFHDCAKPACFHLDEKGVGHFYGHAQKSAALADELLRQLKAGNALREEVCTLVAGHDDPMPLSDKVVRKRLSKYGETRFFRLLQLKEADDRGKAPDTMQQGLAHIHQLRETAARLLKTEGCITLRTLAVNGGDLAAMGYSGKEIGKALQSLLNRVLEGKLANTRDALLAAAKRNAPKKSAQVRE